MSDAIVEDTDVLVGANEYMFELEKINLWCILSVQTQSIVV